MKKKLLFLFALVFVLLSSANAQKKTIAFVEDPSNFSTLQDGVKNALTAANYDVTSISISDGLDFAALGNYGIVIISRTLYSSAINDPAGWAALDVPVLILSPYVLGYDALNLLGGIDWSNTSISDEGTTSTITQATPLIEDDVFEGVTSEGADFDFYTYFYNIPYYKTADFASFDNSGTPMVSIKSGSVLGGDDAVIMARWPANKETYPGSGTSPAAIRSFIGIGADIWEGPKNYDNYTDQSKQLLLNEVSYLMSLSKNGNVSGGASKRTIAFVEDPSNFSTLQDGVKNALTAANYDVTSIPISDGLDFAALDNYGIVIISRTLYSSSINDPVAWAALDVPVLILSPYVLGYDALNLLGGIDWSNTSTSDEGTTSTITQATPLIEDDVFEGVTSEGADFDFYTYFYNIPYYKTADFASFDNSGTPIVSIKSGSVLGGDDAVIMARWPANKETYPGSGTSPAAIRSFIGIGADIWDGPKNYDNYTDQSKLLLLNEVSYLMSLSKNGDVSGGNSNATIAFIEDPNNFSTLQDGVKEALTAANYNVTIMSVDDGFDFDVLANYGVVIMSRTITSNAITEAASWAELDVPMLVMSPYVLGYDKLNFLGGIDKTYVNKSEDGTATTITQATPLVEDDVFEGVTSNGADFDFYTSFYNIPYYKASDFTAYENSGIPMVAIKNGSVLGGDGAVIMARWPANTETYPGSGTTPAAVRSYIGIGADVWGGPYNYDNYTDQSKKLLVNEVGYLMSLSTETPTSVDHSLFSTEGSVNVYPNPSTDGRITLTLTEKTQKSAILKIHSITGRMVYTTDLGYEDNCTLNIKLNKGMYLATIIQDGKKTSKKIIVH